MNVTHPYEVHLTLEGVSDIDQLFADCLVIGNVKPVILDLYLKNKDMDHQVTTSSTFHKLESYAMASELALAQQEKFESLGYKVSRLKIETVPWNPIIKQFDKPFNYWESHYTFEIESKRENDLRTLLDRVGMKLSRNSLKKDREGYVKFMGTHRLFNTTSWDTIVEKLKLIDVWLEGRKYPPLKKIVEYVLLDTNYSVDHKWVNA